MNKSTHRRWGSLQTMLVFLALDILSCRAWGGSIQYIEPAKANGMADALLTKWSRQWLFDRYVPGSAITQDQVNLNSQIFSTGIFEFLRGGKSYAIPFSIQIFDDNIKTTALGICYDDRTSTGISCFSTSGANNQLLTSALQNGVGYLGRASAAGAPSKSPQKNVDEMNVPELIKLAESGDVKAQGRLAIAYLYGRGVEKNVREGFRWQQKAADGGDLESQYQIAAMLFVGEDDGTISPMDLNQAEKLATACANHGYAKCQGLMSKIRFRRDDRTGAVVWLKKGAEGGDLESQSNLAQLYAKGKHVERSNERFLYWIRKAADQGYAEAQRILGQQYLNISGKGPIPQDLQKGERYLRMAAQQDDAAALYFLALFANKSEREGQTLMLKSAQLGYVEAQYMLGDWYLRGVGGVPKDPEQSRYWISKAAAQGHEKAKQLLK